MWLVLKLKLSQHSGGGSVRFVCKYLATKTVDLDRYLNAHVPERGELFWAPSAFSCRPWFIVLRVDGQVDSRFTLRWELCVRNMTEAIVYVIFFSTLCSSAWTVMLCIFYSFFYPKHFGIKRLAQFIVSLFSCCVLPENSPDISSSELLPTAASLAERELTSVLRVTNAFS